MQSPGCADWCMVVPKAVLEPIQKGEFMQRVQISGSELLGIEEGVGSRNQDVLHIGFCGI